MSTLSLRIPKHLHDKIKQIVASESISINQFITSALAEKISALETENYLEQRAKKASKDKFQKVLKKVPDIPAEKDDL
jgi:predicted DNA binding CopG/RHH family protein